MKYIAIFALIVIVGCHEYNLDPIAGTYSNGDMTISLNEDGTGERVFCGDQSTFVWEELNSGRTFVNIYVKYDCCQTSIFSKQYDPNVLKQGEIRLQRID